MSQDDHRATTADVWEGPGYAAPRLVPARLLLLAAPEASGTVIRRIGQGLEARLTADYISGKLKHLAFTAAARVVLGRPAERPDCEEFWREVAFSNDAGAFDELLERTSPHAVLVLGEETWLRLPPADAARSIGMRIYRYPAGSSVAACIPHPAAPGFEFREHTAAVASLLAQAARLRQEH